VADIFKSKMELVCSDLNYGDTWEDLDEPLIILSELDPFPTTGMTYTSNVRPGTHRSSSKRARQMFKDGILPALNTAFGITPDMYPVCYRRRHKFVYDNLRFCLGHDDFHYSQPAIINCDAETMFLCFCPDRAATPSLSVSGILNSREMQKDYDVTHTLFLDHESPTCWQDHEEFWAAVDEGYGAVPLPYAWQPYYSDLDSQLTHPTLSEAYSAQALFVSYLFAGF